MSSEGLTVLIKQTLLLYNRVHWHTWVCWSCGNTQDDVIRIVIAQKPYHHDCKLNDGCLLLTCCCYWPRHIHMQPHETLTTTIKDKSHNSRDQREQPPSGMFRNEAKSVYVEGVAPRVKAPLSFVVHWEDPQCLLEQEEAEGHSTDLYVFLPVWQTPVSNTKPCTPQRKNEQTDEKYSEEKLKVVKRHLRKKELMCILGFWLTSSYWGVSFTLYLILQPAIMMFLLNF